jgi:hypothetical protein
LCVGAMQQRMRHRSRVVRASRVWDEKPIAAEIADELCGPSGQRTLTRIWAQGTSVQPERGDEGGKRR